jgi:DNA-binding Lrp family transcriptional regulator
MVLPAEETETRVLDWLQHQGPTTVRKLRRATGASEMGVILTLQDLEEAGRVRANRGDGVTTWELT